MVSYMPARAYMLRKIKYCIFWEESWGFGSGAPVGYRGNAPGQG